MTKTHVKHAMARLAPRRDGGTRVLMYHAIGDPDPADRLALRVSHRQFLDQMTLLRDEGYAVVPLASVADPAPARPPRVAITFDDGYCSQRDAAGVLRRFGFPATFFLVPRFLDGVADPAAYWERWGYLGWSDAASLLEDGFDVGGHSATHRDLTACGDEELAGEVTGCRAQLESRLGRPVTAFSYPFGREDGRVRRAVARAGFALACNSRVGVNHAGRVISHAIRRTEIAGTDTLQDFRWKLQGKYDWFGYWQDARAAARRQPARTQGA
jgi:peptidoglycan/xylan/chitin deacetylase (PgdA/CDA1 family)